jgi:Flp pilus assembly pilin Flp
MINILSKIKEFLVDEQGAETVEWAMIAAILAGIIIAAYLNSLGDGVKGAINQIINQIGFAK